MSKLNSGLLAAVLAASVAGTANAQDQALGLPPKAKTQQSSVQEIQAQIESTLAEDPALVDAAMQEMQIPSEQAEATQPPPGPHRMEGTYHLKQLLPIGKIAVTVEALADGTFRVTRVRSTRKGKVKSTLSGIAKLADGKLEVNFPRARGAAGALECPNPNDRELAADYRIDHRGKMKGIFFNEGRSEAGVYERGWREGVTPPPSKLKKAFLKLKAKMNKVSAKLKATLTAWAYAGADLIERGRDLVRRILARIGEAAVAFADGTVKLAKKVKDGTVKTAKKVGAATKAAVWKARIKTAEGLEATARALRGKKGASSQN